jgi:hypothetical protein
MADWFHYWMEGSAKTESTHTRQANEIIFRAQIAF